MTSDGGSLCIVKRRKCITVVNMAMARVAIPPSAGCEAERPHCTGEVWKGLAILPCAD